MIFTSEHKRFIVESYFLMAFSSTENEHTALLPVWPSFGKNFPNFAFLEADISCVV
jgi:hypothetical protein